MNDDEQIGHLLTRREALAVFGSVGLVWMTGGTSGSGSQRNPGILAPNACVARPAQTEGPYFVDEMLNRSDIRSDPVNKMLKQGAPLALAFNISQIVGNTCKPLPGAMVDVWHCDAEGVYSDATDPGFDTKGQKFLRGYQLTDAAGQARFLTIYPGWYPQRAVHIHFKVRSPAGVTPAYEFTSQVYFDEATTDKVHHQAPYVKPGKRRLNGDDGIFRSGGSQLILAVAPDGQGYKGAFDVSLQVG